MTDIAIEYDRKQILHPLYTEEGVAAKPLLISITLIYSHKRLPDSSIWHPEDGAVARGRRRREEVGRSLAQSVRAVINDTFCFGHDSALLNPLESPTVPVLLGPVNTKIAKMQ